MSTKAYLFSLHKNEKEKKTLLNQCSVLSFHELDSHIYDINYFWYENVRATHMDALQN